MEFNKFPFNNLIGIICFRKQIAYTRLSAKEAINQRST